MRHGTRVICSRRHIEARPRLESGTTCRGSLEIRSGIHEFLASADRAPRLDCYAVRMASGGKARGQTSFLDIQPERGVIEIGSIWFVLTLRRTRSGTESMYLMIRYAMDDLGYRRMQWRCNALNATSRAAARRLGFRFEGIFHNYMIFKGRNRDTAWYSILDDEWTEVREIMDVGSRHENFRSRRHCQNLVGRADGRTRSQPPYVMSAKRQNPLLAHSGHPWLHRTCPLSGGRADIAFCGANVRF
jgi:RimJ/RimL family protein N-acetyltransferase